MAAEPQNAWKEPGSGVIYEKEAPSAEVPLANANLKRAMRLARELGRHWGGRVASDPGQKAGHQQASRDAGGCGQAEREAGGARRLAQRRRQLRPIRDLE